VTQDTIAFLETVVGGPAHLVGCSDDAIVWLLVALARPDLVDRLVLVAGVFHYDGWLPHVIDPSNQPPEFLARLYEEVSPDGAGHYQVVVDKLARMHTQEPTLTPKDLGAVRSRTLIMVGDDDEVRLEHAVAMYRAIDDVELMVVPGTSHGRARGEARSLQRRHPALPHHRFRSPRWHRSVARADGPLARDRPLARAAAVCREASGRGDGERQQRTIE
jgi:pimeloyl-ACP methyl ester carboxylesterase